ncbi:hypothetical protein, partial [Chryseobacterium ginsengisoli]|uniref:hypothetical protein n=1 Tax=Chryseobacterium ginsengisoli TaxID=363853 RepID=UPI0031E7A711
MKFVDQPISYATGIPNINVPIYNLNLDGKLDIPVNLSYNSGGITVDQVSTWVGLGWNLNGGGVITRNVKGSVDFYNQGDHVYQEVKAYKDNVQKYDASNFEFYLNSKEPQDLQPDSFALIAPNLNIKFVYDPKSQQFVQTPKSSVKIIPSISSTGTIGSWKVVDDRGFEYYFGNIDGRFATETMTGGINIATGSNSPSGNSQLYTRSWHLLKIVSPTGKAINYYYDDQIGYEQWDLIGQYKYKCIPMPGFSATPSNSYLLSKDICNSQNNILQTTFSTQNVNYLTLNKIETEDAKVEFIKSLSNREDITTLKYLQKIIISDKVNNETISNYDFLYSYYNNINYDSNYLELPNILQSIYNNNNKRLKLDNFVLKDKNNVEIGRYTFSYYTTTLPNRLSYARDAWGYYNGAHNNTNLIPNITFDQGQGNNSIIQIGDADRNINTDFAKYGILNKIQYPTGGSVNFEYESNDFKTFYDINSPSTAFLGVGNYNTNTVDFAGESSIDDNGNVVYQNTYTNNFIVNENNTNISVHINIEGCGLNAGTNCMYSISLTKLNDTSFQPITLTNTFNNTNFVLNSGEYILTANKINNGQIPTYGFNMSLMWTNSSAVSSSNTLAENHKSGGLRIKKVRFNDSTNSSIKEKNFEYNSSGILWSLPIFIESKYDKFQKYVNKFYGLAIFPFSNLTSSITSYYDVSELTSDINTNKKIKNNYIFSSNSGDDNSNLISDTNFSIPITSNTIEWRVGNLIEKKDYETVNDNYRIVKKEKNIYNAYSPYINNDFGARIEVREQAKPDINSSERANQFSFEFYSLFTESYKLKQKEITDFSYKNNVVDSIKTTINYQYNNLTHMFPTKEVSLFPDSTIKETIYSYAAEKNNQLMISKNMIGIPLETTTTQTIGTVTKTL